MASAGVPPGRPDPGRGGCAAGQHVIEACRQGALLVPADVGGREAVEERVAVVGEMGTPREGRGGGGRLGIGVRARGGRGCGRRRRLWTPERIAKAAAR